MKYELVGCHESYCFPLPPLFVLHLSTVLQDVGFSGFLRDFWGLKKRMDAINKQQTTKEGGDFIFRTQYLFICVFFFGFLLCCLNYRSLGVGLKRTGVPVSYVTTLQRQMGRRLTSCCAPITYSTSLGFLLTSTVTDHGVFVLSYGCLVSYVGQSEVPASLQFFF